jgi:hypothetical protein
MLTVSREALVKLAKHSWNLYPLEAFGYLLGSSADNVIYAALPCSKTQRWYEYGDRWNGIAQHADKAASVARRFGLELVGVYASFYAYADDSGDMEDYPAPPALATSGMGVMLNYYMLCCRSCSLFRITQHGQPLTYGDDYVLTREKRLTRTINQRRILQEWRKVFGPIDYSNGYGLMEAIRAYTGRFDEGPPVLGWDEQKAISAINEALAKGHPIERGAEAGIPDGAILG